MASTYYHGRLCDSNLSYEFYTQPPMKINLVSLANEMEDHDLRLEIKTKFVLVTLFQGTRVSIYPSGKILLKNLHVQKEANALFLSLSRILEDCPAFERGKI